MTNSEFLKKIRTERELQLAIGNLAALAIRVFELEEKVKELVDGNNIESPKTSAGDTTSKS